MKKIFSFCLTVILSMVGMSAFAGNTTKYFRATAITTNSMEGLVYVAAASTPTPEYSDTVSVTDNESTQGESATHNFYYYAEAQEGFKFVGWATTQDAESFVSDENPYKRTMTSSSQDQNNPATDTLYAFFDLDSQLYSSLVIATANGQGVVSVSDTAGCTEFTEVMSDTTLNSPETMHTYYLQARMEGNVEFTNFVGWYSDAACTELLSLASNYTYVVTATSTDETAPTIFNVYAKFDTRSPYQFKNAGFEYWNAKEDEPAPGWHGPATAIGSMAGLAAGSAPAPRRVAGRTGQYAVELHSASVMGVKANGNLTTGIMNMGSMTATSTSNNNHTVVDDPEHHLIITGQPDSLVYYSKFKKGESKDYMASAKVYLHSGDVDFQDPVISEQNQYLMGYCYTPAPESTDWIRNAGAFEYYDEQGWTVDSINKTTIYVLCDLATNPNAGASAGDTLVIDDIRFVYNSMLASAKQGEDTIVFEDAVADMTTVEYDEEALVLTANGRGATIETEYNDETAQLSIIVKGNDIEANELNFHTYQINFKKGGTPTGVESMNAESFAKKRFVNGQIVIIRDNRSYNVHGAQLK